MTAIDFLCRRLGLAALVVPVAILVGISNVGAAAAYLSSTARLPFVVGINHYLPAVFGRIHPRWKTPYVAIISYGLAGIVFGLLSQAGTSVKGAYDFLVSHEFDCLLHSIFVRVCLDDPFAISTFASWGASVAGRQTGRDPARVLGFFLDLRRYHPFHVSRGG